MPRTAQDFWLDEDDESTDDERREFDAIAPLYLAPPLEPMRRRSGGNGDDDE